jgi:hypothetical protein
MTKAPPDRDIGTPVHRKPGAHDGYKCELCGDWIELRNLREVLAHEGPLPHISSTAIGFPKRK